MTGPRAHDWPDYDDNQYSLTDSTGKELTLLRGNTPEEAIERAKDLIGSNEKLLATFGLVKLTPKPYYIVRGGKRQGVAEGSRGSPRWPGLSDASTGISSVGVLGGTAPPHVRKKCSSCPLQQDHHGLRFRTLKRYGFSVMPVVILGYECQEIPPVSDLVSDYPCQEVHGLGSR